MPALGYINLQVQDQMSGNPVPNASVEIKGPVLIYGTTNSLGDYTCCVQENYGEYTVTATNNGQSHSDTVVVTVGSPVQSTTLNL